jgi:hypothetical protein
MDLSRYVGDLYRGLLGGIDQGGFGGEDVGGNKQDAIIARFVEAFPEGFKGHALHHLEGEVFQYRG